MCRSRSIAACQGSDGNVVPDFVLSFLYYDWSEFPIQNCCIYHEQLQNNPQFIVSKIPIPFTFLC